MSWILEQPITVGVVGSIVTGLLAYLGTQTPSKQKPLFIGAGFVAIVTIVLLFTGGVVETEQERVKKTLFRIAELVENNNVDDALLYVHPTAESARRRAAAELPRYKFSGVDIKPNLEITIDENHSPPKAVATFNVVVRGSDKSGLLGSRPVPLFARVTFLQENGQWKISDYQYEEPTMGQRRGSRSQ